MKGNVIIMEKVEMLKEAEFKDVLWRLCYMPEETLKELELEGSDAKEVKQAVLQKAKENPKFFFAGDTPCVDTLGIDLGVKNAILRDVLIEKCSELVSSRNRYIEKAIALLRKQDNGTDYAKRNIIGGLKILGFSNEEANYIFDTCNLYPVSLFLERLYEKAKQEGYFTRKTVRNVESTQEENQQTCGNHIVNLLNHKDLIKEIFDIAGDFITEEQVLDALKNAKEPIAKLEKLKKQIAEVSDLVTFDESVTQKIDDAIKTSNEPISGLETLVSKIQHLKKKGISFDEVIAKKNALLSVFEAAAML